MIGLPPNDPANDNGRPLWFPVFTELFDEYKYDLTRTDIHVYGAMVALQRVQASPTVKQIAIVANLPTSGDAAVCRRSISKLVAAGLIQRTVPGGQGVPAVYTLLGPDIGDCVA